MVLLELQDGDGYLPRVGLSEGIARRCAPMDLCLGLGFGFGLGVSLQRLNDFGSCVGWIPRLPQQSKDNRMASEIFGSCDSIADEVCGKECLETCPLPQTSPDQEDGNAVGVVKPFPPEAVDGDDNRIHADGQQGDYLARTMSTIIALAIVGCLCIIGVVYRMYYYHRMGDSRYSPLGVCRGCRGVQNGCQAYSRRLVPPDGAMRGSKSRCVEPGRLPTGPGRNLRWKFGASCRSVKSDRCMQRTIENEEARHKLVKEMKSLQGQSLEDAHHRRAAVFASAITCFGFIAARRACLYFGLPR
eukprot:scaffold434_cov186-Pinguiococcus_pyrenoidosus.AAC.48